MFRFVNHVQALYRETAATLETIRATYPQPPRRAALASRSVRPLVELRHARDARPLVVAHLARK